MDNTEAAIIIGETLEYVASGIREEVIKQNSNIPKVLVNYNPYNKINANPISFEATNESDDDSDDEFSYNCDYGTYFIKFNDENIRVVFEKKSEPFPLYDRIDYKKKLTLYNNTYNDYKKNLQSIERLIKYHSDKKIQTLEKYIKIKVLVEDYWRYYSKIPKRNLNTIYLNFLDEIVEDLDKFFESKNLYKSEGRPYKRNYLLHGPPGTGKSSLIIGIASKYNKNIYKINLTNNLDDTLLMSAISKVPNNGIIIFEDIDQLFTKGETSDFNRTNITFGGLLNILDGFVSKCNIISILTTNLSLDKINDSNQAFLRPGRIDKFFEFNYSNISQITNICEKYIEDDEIRKDFITQIKNIKTTSAALTKFLFECIKIESIKDVNSKENIEKYIEITKQYKLGNEMYN